LILDPGLGFAKESSHNWEILSRLKELIDLGFPLLIGASRKRFLGELTGATSADDREAASIALTTLLAGQGVWGVRVHSVKAHRDAIAVVGEF
jgi:dihydropteroate synthase